MKQVKKAKKVTKKKQSKAEERVTLAKDVIRTIRDTKGFNIQVETGSYISGDLYDRIADILYSGDGSNDSADARKVLKQLKRENMYCVVCAKGALLIAHVIRNDKMRLDRFKKLAGNMSSAVNESGTTYPEGIAFTRRQLDEIEGLFEGGLVGNAAREVFSPKEQTAILDWYGTEDSWSVSRTPHLSDYERLIAIMKLVIKNKGKKILL